jgi:pimeloyl-ACP methyl ester carboxylesterase
MSESLCTVIKSSSVRAIARPRRFPYGYRRFHADLNLNYQLNRFLGEAPEERIARIAARIDGLADWKREMLSAAASAEVTGEIKAAASYYRAAEFFMSPQDPDKVLAYDKFVSLFWQAHGADTGERVQVRYEGHTLPALRFSAIDAQSTVVVHAGFDAFLEEFVGFGQALRDDGFDVILFEGPGQGEPLIKQGLTMTPEWERPVAAVLDHFGLRDVTLIGISLGGYLAPRAAAFEPRIARVVAFDVMYDFFDCVTSHGSAWLRGAARTLLSTTPTAAVLDAALRSMMESDATVKWGIEQGMHVTGARSPAAFLSEVRRYSLADVSCRIKQDFLLLAGAEDHLAPLAQFYAQAHALTAVRSLTTRLFTPQEEAQSHCQYGNMDLALAVIADWIHERVSSLASTGN